MSTHEVLTLPDGRALGYAFFGDANGAPVFYFHGALSSRLEGRLLDPAARRMGIRIIAVDRPGMGLSTPEPARTLGSFATDIARLADHLMLGRFGLTGWSGGASYAGAVAAILGKRITRVSLIAAFAPELARARGTLLVRLFSALSSVTSIHLRITAWVIGRLLALRGAKMFRSLPQALFCKADRRSFSNDNFTSVLTESWSEGMRQGTRAAAEDVALLLRPWARTLRDADCPVEIWCGDEDRICPPSHGQSFAKRLGNAQVTVLPKQGHLHIAEQAERILSAHAPTPLRLVVGGRR